MHARFEVFPEHNSPHEGMPSPRWRWRLRSGNNEIDGQGTESYRDEHDARRGVHDVVGTVAAACGVVIDPANVEILTVDR